MIQNQPYYVLGVQREHPNMYSAVLQTLCPYEPISVCMASTHV